MAKSKNPTITTPRVELKWAHLHTPNTRFDPDGTYEVDMILDPSENDDHQTLIDKIEGMVESLTSEMVENTKDARRKAKIKKYQTVSPIKEELDEDGEETGRFVLKAKQKAVLKREGKKPMKFSVAVVDAKRNPLGEQIGNGSVGRVNMQIAPYAMDTSKTLGITLRLQAVQVIDLVEYSGGPQVDDMFEEEEGFESEGVSENSGEVFDGVDEQAADDTAADTGDPTQF